MLKVFGNLSYLFLLAMHIGMHLCLNFEAESETTKGTNFKLVCSIDQSSFTGQVISLLKDGSSKSTCDNANNCLPFDSDSGRYKYSSNASSVTVEISVANHLTDSGNWKCKLGVIKEQDYELVVKTIPTFKNFTQTIPDSNSSELVENVKLSGRCYCIFPPPSVNLYYKVGTGAFELLEKIPDPFINKHNETSSCEPYEFDVEVSNFTVKMIGKTNVFFEMHFDDQISSDFVGPFSFFSEAGCKYSDVELFMCGFSCFPIVFGESFIIMLIFLFCKMFLKIFGALKTIKVTIIFVYDLVALIIGLSLGFSLKECDQRDLGLGLGLGFGFILAIALVVTLYIYHKKCGSKKENEDENGKKPEDNPQRVGLKS